MQKRHPRKLSCFTNPHPNCVELAANRIINIEVPDELLHPGSGLSDRLSELINPLREARLFAMRPGDQFGVFVLARHICYSTVIVMLSAEVEAFSFHAISTEAAEPFSVMLSR